MNFNILHYFQWWKNRALEEYILGDLEAVTEAAHQNSYHIQAFLLLFAPVALVEKELRG